MNSEKCKQFFQKQDVNPLTKRKITINGPTHKKLTKECEAIVRAAPRRTTPPRVPTPVRKSPTPRRTTPPRVPTPVRKSPTPRRTTPPHVPTPLIPSPSPYAPSPAREPSPKRIPSARAHLIKTPIYTHSPVEMPTPKRKTPTPVKPQVKKTLKKAFKKSPIRMPTPPKRRTPTPDILPTITPSPRSSRGWHMDKPFSPSPSPSAKGRRFKYTPVPKMRQNTPPPSKNPRIRMMGVEKTEDALRKTLDETNRKDLDSETYRKLTLMLVKDKSTRDYLSAFMPVNAFVKNVKQPSPPVDVIGEFVTEITFILDTNLTVHEGGITRQAMLGEVVSTVNLTDSVELVDFLKEEKEISYSVVKTAGVFWNILHKLQNYQVYIGFATGLNPQINGIELEWFIPFMFSNKEVRFIFVLVDRDYSIDNLWKNLTDTYHFNTTINISEIEEYKSLSIFV